MNKRALRVGAIAILAMVVGRGAIAEVPTPWIGIELDQGKHGGALVKHVLEGTPAEKAGLHDGDEVLSIDGAKATTPRALVEAVQRAGVNSTVKLRVLDERGKSRTVSLTLESRPSMDDVQRQSLVGKVAPDFLPTVQAGAKLGKLSSLRGHVVLIDFFATWCAPCREEMPHIEELHHKLAAKGLQVIGVSTESAPIVADAAAKFKLTYPLASDENEEVSGRYRVFALPTMVVIDRKGVVREVSVADPDTIDRAVDAALADRPVK